MLEAEEALIEICADELWDGVYCMLPPGHRGSHEHKGRCALSWRADATPVPTPLPSMPHIESFLRMIRGASVHR